MATITVEGVPSSLLFRLATTAASNGRCVNSEVILSLVRYLQADQSRTCPSGSGGAACPFRTWIRSEGRREASAPWGDPG